MKTKKTLFTFFLCAVLIALGSVHAAPYGEGRKTIFTQPDGSVIPLRVFGDEFYAVTETDGGYTVVFDSEAKAYYYAVLAADGDDLQPSGVIVRAGNDPHTMGFRKHLRVSPEARKVAAKKSFEAYDQVVKQTEAWRKKKERMRAYRLQKSQSAKKNPGASLGGGEGEAPAGGASLPEFAPPETLGSTVGITILVDFSDDPAGIAKSDVDDCFNKPGYTGYGNKGSVYDYFYTQSARKLRYNNVITYYVRMPYPKSYYNNTAESSGTCGRRLLTDALHILTAAGFDFSACTPDGSGNIKACNLLFAGVDSGVWAKGLWPHRSTLSSAYNVGGGRRVYDYQMSDVGSSLTIGTICHENGHMLCKYPDFYDYDGDSEGCGKYTLMASGNHYYQTSPISVGAYLRYHSGWVDSVLLVSNATERCSVRVDEGRIYMYDNPSAWQGEYFLLENRARIGWEASSGLPDQGLLIMHCDENGDRDSQQMTESQHYECSIEQADNAFQLERDVNSGDAYDLFHNGGTGANTSFSDSTSPNAHWWKNATTSTLSGDPSGLNIHGISTSGETMTFISGTGSPAGIREIGLDQSSIYMEAEYGTDAPSASFAVWNKQSGTLSYSIIDDASWLSISPNSGSASAESDVIHLFFDSSGLSAGTYNATVTVTDNGASNSPQTLSVQLVVANRPVIAVDSTELYVSATSGSVTSRVLKISNSGGGSMNYSLSNSASWLSLDCSAGTVLQEQDLIVLTFDASALPGGGTYHDTLTVVSSNAANSPLEIGVWFDVDAAPSISVEPSSLALYAEPESTDAVELVISNTGGGDLRFELTSKLWAVAYIESDSDDPGGPAYNWIDISALGSQVTLADDDESAMLPIGFSFPFCDNVYTQVQIGANGGISFSSGDLNYRNYELPSYDAPSQSLLAFWDDLNPEAGGSIRYHGTTERLVVSWLGVPFRGKSYYQTFQIVLYPDGRIVYQYNTLNGTLTSATVGLQDDNRAGQFVQVAYNQSWLKNGLAVQFMQPDWLTYNANSGRVSSGAATSVWFTGSASNLEVGVYTARVTVACNDTENPLVYVPVSFNIWTADGDADSDGIPNGWEQQYFGGPTNAHPGAICSNGINTVLEAYIAGLNPNDLQSRLQISDFRSLTEEKTFGWNAVSGRVYSVYWTTNLLSGFQCLESNIPWTSALFTNETTLPCGYYKINVRMDQ